MAADKMNMAKYIVSHLDEQMGPFEEHELKAKWVKGELLPIDYVFDDVKQDWVLLTEKFPWASGKAESATPPPLREISVKKKLPTVTAKPAPAVAAKPLYDLDTGEMVMPPALNTSGNSHKPVMKPHHETPAPNEHTQTQTSSASVRVESLMETGKIQVQKMQNTQVKLLGGVGEFDLSLLEPGQVELILQNPGNLSLQQPAKIKVTPAEPFSVEWSIPHQRTVGEEVVIHIRGLDRSGQLCSHYEDDFVIRVNGAETKEYKVHMKRGECLLKIQNTKAEIWVLSFNYSGTRTLKMPHDKTLEWLPGPAAKLILDTPPEYIAGHPLKVHVKAVDAYGNLAKSFSGTVALEVKAS